MTLGGQNLNQSFVKSPLKVISLALVLIFSSPSLYAQSEKSDESLARKELQAEFLGQTYSKQKKETKRVAPRRQAQPSVSQSNTLSEPIEDIEPVKKNWAIDAEILSGFSSNVARFEGAPSGSFLDLAPSVFYLGQLGSRLDFEISADAFYRTFSDINFIF